MRVSKRLFLSRGMILWLLCLTFVSTRPVLGQENVNGSPAVDAGEESGRGVAPRVFLDCGSCDFSHIRQEITFVNYVRDPELADVHVFITSQRTGSGGETFTLNFTGQQTFAGLDNVLTQTSAQGQTGPERRDGLTNIIRIGLVSYVARTPLVGSVRVLFDQPTTTEPEPVYDPWDSWVFDLEGSGSFRTEASNTWYSLNSGVSADRVTEAWKIGIGAYGNTHHEEYLNEDELISSTSYSAGVDGRLIKSITNHWSAGVFSSVSTTTYRNLDLNAGITPAIEYNIFPYSASSRKELTLSYRVGLAYREYIEQTVFGKMRETLLSESLHANVSIRQPWGQLFTGMSGSHYFHDASKNSLSFYSNLSLRISRGLSLRFTGNFEIIHDQLYLAKGDASLEEILLQQRQLATTYEVYGSIGLAYTFGSIYNNVVNTRL